MVPDDHVCSCCRASSFLSCPKLFERSPSTADADAAVHAVTAAHAEWWQSQVDIITRHLGGKYYRDRMPFPKCKAIAGALELGDVEFVRRFLLTERGFLGRQLPQSEKSGATGNAVGAFAILVGMVGVCHETH